jgi:large subunit ribosomal protein L18e
VVKWAGLRSQWLSAYAGSSPVFRIRKMKTGTTNPNLRNLIQEIKETSAKEGSGFWKRIVKELEKPGRNRREVNIYRINENTKDKEVVIVPGKVLGNGNLDHDVTVAALQFSESASEKIKNKITIKELLKSNPKGKDVRIIG